MVELRIFLGEQRSPRSRDIRPLTVRFCGVSRVIFLELTVNDLEHDVMGTLRRNRSGSESTKANRRDLTMRFANRLGRQFRGLRLANLKSGHIDWYLTYLTTMRSERTGRVLETGTQKNNLAAVRWLLQCIGKRNLLPKTNARLGIKRRVYVTNISKAIDVSDDVIEAIAAHNQYAAVALLLSREFGLRVEESLKIVPKDANDGEMLRLKGSWTKGNVSRAVPILHASQREAIRRARELVGDDSLIPKGRLYSEHLRSSRDLYNKFGIHENHGLRHEYAQRRFRALAGFECPARGGPMREAMTDEQYRADRNARKDVSRELGHGRVSITSVYLGSPTLSSPLKRNQLDRLIGEL